MGGAGRVSTVLDLDSGHLLIGIGLLEPPKTSRHDCLRRGDHDDRSGLLPHSGHLRRESVPGVDGRSANNVAGGWQRIEPIATKPLHGDPSAHVVPRLCRFHGAVRFRHRLFDYQAAGRPLDPYNSGLDDGDLVVSRRRRSAWRQMGLCGTRLGRLLGLGPRRKRLPAALDNGNGFFALGHDAGKERHDEDVEHRADLRHFLPVHFWHHDDAQRAGQLRSCFRTVAHRRLLRMVSHTGDRCHHFPYSEPPRLPQKREPARFRAFSRVKFSV